MIKRTIQLAFVWLTVLGILVQSLGAAGGGVLCLGCDDASGAVGGIGLTIAPCAPHNDCCAQKSTDQTECNDDRDMGGDKPGAPNDCNCVDIALSPGAGVLSRSPVKFVLLATSVMLTPATIVALPHVEEAGPWSVARSGPLIVRLLLPSGRQTVLLI